MPQINRCIMQELHERQFGITTEKQETGAIKLKDELFCREVKSLSLVPEDCFWRVYLGQAVKQQDAIRRLQNYYNQKQLLGIRLQSNRHMPFSLICCFIVVPLFPIIFLMTLPSSV